MDGIVTLGGANPVGIAEIVAVARDRARVGLAPEVAGRLAAARAVVERAAARGDAVYGLTTGLGAAVDTRLGEADLAAFQRRAVEARAVAVGPCLTTEEVRAALTARLAGLAWGASGIAPPFVEAIAAMLNAGVHPRARRIGSLGEADLAPLAEIFLPLVGAGEAEFDGVILPGVEALARAGIVPPAFGMKDGIALLNGNAVSVGTGAFALEALRLALDALTAAAALSLEAFRANLSPLDARLNALRPGPGQERGAARLRALLDGSDLFEPGQARRVQDPLSFRCLGPVEGAVQHHWGAAETALAVELNGAGDSPAVLVDEDAVLSSANFDTTALALAFEGVNLAVAHAAALSVHRVMKLMSPAFSELPRFLTRRGGSRTGFATGQKTAAALEAGIRALARPIGPMTTPVADGVEDYAPMTPDIIEASRAIAARVARLAAVELIVAAQAVDLRTGIRLGRGTGRTHAFVRGLVAPLDEDRATGAEFEGLALAIEAGALDRVVTRA